MNTQWQRLIARLTAHHPDRLAGLNPPASAQRVADLERELGVSLPDDYVQCLLVHDGQDRHAEWLFDGTEFLSTTRVLREWKVWHALWASGEFAQMTARPDPGVKPLWWSPKWIPFTYNGAGDHLCLDLDPDTGGQYGQVIALWHDAPRRERIADSFGQWFSQLIARQQ